METQRLILVGAAVVQLALWLILAGRYRTPAPGPDEIVLRYGWKLRLLGLCIAFAIPLLLILAMILTPRLQTPLLLPMGLILLALGMVGGALLVETQGVHILVRPTSVIGISPWRGRRDWAWSAIERVTYSMVNRWLILHGPNQERIRASVYLTNIGEFARLVPRQLGAATYAPARRVIERLGAQ